MTPAAPTDPDVLLMELVATPEGRADPYGRYRTLRTIAPVHHSTFGMWVLSRYDDCQSLLRHPEVGKDFSGLAATAGLNEAQQAEQAAFRNDRSNMLFADPPDHTRLRSLATRAFTPRTVEKLRPHVIEIVDGLIDGFEGEVDVMDALAFRLPITVIGEMLGVPAADRPQFRPLVRSLTAVLELTISPEAVTEATAASNTMEAYFRDLIAERRREATDDLLSKLIEAEEEGDKLTEYELISTSILLFAAGFETTTHLIGNGLLALLQHPDEMARLRADRALVRSAVEELVRYDSPVQITARTAYADIRVDDHVIPRGDVVLGLLGAANRDPARFTEPDRLDVGRSEGNPLSFGSGIHFCLGAVLARLEGQVVFDRLLARLRTIELLGGPPPHRDSLTLRGLTELPVRVGH